MPDDQDTNIPPPLDPDRLTWAVLLARWTEFSRSAVALPEHGQGGLVKRSIADIITLQAVWFSLSHLEELDSAEQAIGLDRAGLLIQRHTASLSSRYGDQPMPENLIELIEDVESAYKARQGM